MVRLIYSTQLTRIPLIFADFHKLLIRVNLLNQGHQRSLFNCKSYLFYFLIFTTITTSQIKKVVETSSTKKPFVLGIVDEIHSTLLSENRVLNIYLPENYKQNDTIQYPVIYLLGGGADEDFIHTVGLIQYNTFSLDQPGSAIDCSWNCKR